MGSLQASEFAEAVDNGEVQLEAALYWHFTANHYPPLPTALIPLAIRIIHEINAGELDYDDEVELPERVSWRGQNTAPVSACIEAWHLQDYL